MAKDYFRDDEFACPCCEELKFSLVCRHMLNTARDAAGIPFIITSGYRCIKHNTDIGSRPTSSHVKGLAADISVQHSASRFKIISALISAGFTRIGIGPDFLHVDIDESKPAGVIWTYYGRAK